MSRLAEVQIIPRKRLDDSRGWFLKVLKGDEEGLPHETGEIYVVVAEPGEVRGNHYHARTSEWFTVILGEAILRLVDPMDGDRRDMILRSVDPSTIYVPAGIGHAFVNPTGQTEKLMVIAYADRLYDPTDTFPLKVV